MVLPRFLPLFYLWLPLLVSSSSAALGFYESNGQKRLVGSSFGVLGRNATFDYVIIGGGTSGLTVAKRLAEKSNSVAIIEGGTFYEITNGNLSQIPADDSLFAGASPSDIQPLVDWGIVTEPQMQLGGRRIHYTQGRCLGGGSARNFLAYHRGTKGTYQKWADIVGNQNFTFENLLPFFKRSVHFTPPNLQKRNSPPVNYDSDAFDTSGGPLHTSYTNFYQPISDGIVRAYTRLGLNSIPGLNSGELIGFSEPTLTIDPEASTRSSSETSFLQESLLYPSLQVYPQTLAKRIIFDANKTANGVQVATAGVTYSLLASKEVILAAGVFRSPQLLMVSGIGPAPILSDLNIPLISELPGVGQNLQDQPYYGLTFRVNVSTQSRLTSDLPFAAQATEDFLNNQTGPLTSPGGVAIGWEKLPEPLRAALSATTLAELAKFPADWPEIEILPLATAITATNDSDNYAAVTIAVQTTTSRGNVTLRSTDSDINPLVSPNWLLTNSDQEVAIAGFKRARQVAAASGIVVSPEFDPGPAVQTDSQILEFIKQTLAPIHHAVGTCSMGRANDTNAVVDTSGKVFGVRGLRIVDASIFPLLPPGHIQASVYMLAEKLADEINGGD